LIILLEEHKNEARLKFLENLSDCLIQAFDDSGQDGSLARTFEYDFDTILNLQSKGAGVYSAINPTSEGKRDIQHLKHISALVLDLDVCKEKDNLSKTEIEKLKLELIKNLKSKIPYPPHYIIESKNGIQPIWLFEVFKDYTSNEEANRIYRSVVEGMGKQIGTNSEGDNVIRVFRLPYTNHLKTKSDPFEIKIIEDNSKLERYRFADFIKEYGEMSKSVKTIQAEKRELLFDVRGKNETNSKVSKRGRKIKIEDLNLEEVMVEVGREVGVKIEFKDQANGTKTIIENGEATSGFISENGEYCNSMSGKDRKGGVLSIVKYYLKCSRGKTYRWLSKKFNAEIPCYAPHVAEDVMEKIPIAQFQKAYFIYREGIWSEISEYEMNMFIINEMEAQGLSHSRNKINEVRKYIDDNAYEKHGKNLEKKISMAKAKISEVAFSNTILDVEKWVTRDFKPEDYIISKLPHKYEDRPYNCPLCKLSALSIFEILLSFA